MIYSLCDFLCRANNITSLNEIKKLAVLPALKAVSLSGKYDISMSFFMRTQP